MHAVKEFLGAVAAHVRNSLTACVTEIHTVTLRSTDYELPDDNVC
jgi:hypothetical protein